MNYVEKYARRWAKNEKEDLDTSELIKISDKIAV